LRDRTTEKKERADIEKDGKLIGLGALESCNPNEPGEKNSEKEKENSPGGCERVSREVTASEEEIVLTSGEEHQKKIRKRKKPPSITVNSLQELRIRGEKLAKISHTTTDEKREEGGGRDTFVLKYEGKHGGGGGEEGMKIAH